MDREIEPAARCRRRLRRWTPPALAALGLLAAGLWLTGLLRPSLKRERLRTAVVERGSIEAVLSASGVVQPAAERVVASPVEGRVLRVLREPGAMLGVGDPILDLDVSSSRLDLERLEGELAQARARRRELEAELEEMLGEKRSLFEIKRLDLEQLRYQEQQEKELHEQGLLSEVALKRSATLTEKARIELDSVERSMQSSRKSLEARISSLDSAMSVFAREREAAATRLERATTRADRPGVLTWVLDQEGVTVREGDVLARIADLGSFRVEASLSDVHASRIREGQAAWVVVGRRDRLAGRVARINPAVESGALRFWVDLEESGSPLLRASLRVDVLVVTEFAENRLTLAKGPFVNGAGVQRVFVVDGDLAQRRSVRIGMAGWQKYEIEDGLREGDEVVISDVSDYIHLEEVPVR